MKIAILTYLFLGFLTVYGNEIIPAKKDKRDTVDILRDEKISTKEVCQVLCETKFSRCYEKENKSGFKCVAKVVSCKRKCK